MDENIPDLPTAKKPAPSGPGLRTYAFAAVVLAAAFVGLQRLWKDKPVVEGPPPVGAPVQRGGAPLYMPDKLEKSSAGKAVAADQGGPGYVSVSLDMQGAKSAPGAAGPTIDSMSMFFTGEGGPSSFEGRVVKNEKQWASLWRSVGGHDMPRLDTQKEMAVAVFGGIQPAGSIVQIFSAEPASGKLIVSYRIEKPAQPLGGTCRPYKVVVIPTSTLPVMFRAAK